MWPLDLRGKGRGRFWDVGMTACYPSLSLKAGCEKRMKVMLSTEERNQPLLTIKGHAKQKLGLEKNKTNALRPNGSAPGTSTYFYTSVNKAEVVWPPFEAGSRGV